MYLSSTPFSQSSRYLISEPFSLIFQSIYVQGTSLEGKIMDSFIKATLASGIQESILASELLHHREVTIFFPLPLKLFVAHTTKLYPILQPKSYRMSWQKRWIFTHDESL